MTQTEENRTSAAPAPSPDRAGKNGKERAARGRKARDAPEERPAAAETASARQKEAGHRRDQLIVGGEARAHLLPPEVIADRRAAVLHRRLAFGVVGSVVVVALGIAGANAAAVSAQGQLAQAQSATQSLLKQELGYVKVRAVQSQVHLVKTAQAVGASTEIDWMKYLQKVQATLPGNVAITGVNIDSSTPIELYAQPTASLQGPRVATVVFTAKSSSLPLVPSWLDALKTLPGYSDALPGTVNLDSSSGAYTVTITMHVNEKAFSHRFSLKSGK